MKKRFEKLSYVVRISCSLFVSQAIDTVLFSLLGLWGLVDNIASIIVFSFIIKLIIAATATPFTAFAKRLTPAEIKT